MKCKYIIKSQMFVVVMACLFMCCSSSSSKRSFHSSFPSLDRVFLGSEYWANPMDGWKLNDGRAECLEQLPNRNIALLTVEVNEEEGSLHASTDFGLSAQYKMGKSGWLAFSLGTQGRYLLDYKDNAVYGRGLMVGVTLGGEAFIGQPTLPQSVPNPQFISMIQKNVATLDVLYSQEGIIEVKVFIKGEVVDSIKQKVDKISKGGINLMVNIGSEEEDTPPVESPSFWVDNINVKGSKVSIKDNQAFGPILFSMYTVHNRTLRLSAQMAPIGSSESQEAFLEVKKEGAWHLVAQAKIDSFSLTAIFEVKEWDDSKRQEYRVAYDYTTGNGVHKTYLNGSIMKNPKDVDEIIVAGFTGNNDVGFPHREIVDAVLAHKPHFLAFTGDQIYEGVGGYGVDYEPESQSRLDYLRKWYLFGWEYQEILKDIPSIALPDDHDIFHGNFWGDGGYHSTKPEGGNAAKWQDLGGFKESVRFVNMVTRTQTGHFPPPHDPTPNSNGVTMYYTSLNWGGISFAIIADRLFKSAPKKVLPDDYDVYNGWVLNKKYATAESVDVDATLLGKKQLSFLSDWVQDWRENAEMKCVISQTIFVSAATLPKTAKTDNVVPKLKVYGQNEYPPDDVPTLDMDANGWPKKGRNRAVEIIRKGFAFHLAGDQHLGTSIQYALNDWGSSSYALCVPSISNIWPRRWFPKDKPQDWKQGEPRNIGNYYDGFANKFTMLAVANPRPREKKPKAVYERSSGYGILKFRKNDRTIEMANWPRWVDVSSSSAKPYDGWPITVKQENNFAKKGVAYLPTIKVKGLQDPVVIVYNQDKNELVYALRIKGDTFRPKVFTESSKYTIKIGNQDEGDMKILTNIYPSDTEIEVVF